MIKEYDYPMVLNVVIHRYNIELIGEILDMAEQIGTDFVELANTQYYGWSLINRAQLMPTKEQLEKAEAITNKFRERVGNKMKVFMIVTANGDVLPCHSARSLPNLTFPNVKDGTDVEWIWNESPAFNKYRGDDWMKEPCRSCPEKEKDLGGCRCQTYLLTGDAELADPVRSKSPKHDLILKAIEDAKNPQLASLPIVFRNDKNSRKIVDGEAQELIREFHALL